MLGKRIMIIGNGGSGKSTLAVRLGELTGFPVVHLDRLFWRAGWQQVTSEEFDRLLAAELAKDAWIIDGNYNRTIETRLERCDTVIFLDLPRFVCLFRALKRVWKYRGKTRPDMGDACPEKVDREFLAWIWHYNANNRERYRDLFTRFPDKNIFILHNRRKIRRFFEAIADNGTSGSDHASRSPKSA
ncbi:MAG: DNA topology modulation protein [bacterium]